MESYFKAKGFKEFRQVDLTLNGSQVLSAGTITLQLGEVSESVTVSAEITPLQSGSSERSGVLDNKQLENLLAIGRDSMALVRTMPGVVGGEGGSSLGTSSTPTVNGVNSEYNSATIDGVVGNTRGLSTLDTPINMDAVQEVTLMGSNYQAQYGKSAGGNFNFVTKSGTNQFHGGAYYYFRNEDLNANAFFNKFQGANLARPTYRFNTIGGTIGGPVIWPGHFNVNRDKLFFFVSLEYDPTTSPDGVKKYRIPTQAEINGDFSQTYQSGSATNKPVYIRDPLASAADASSLSTTESSVTIPRRPALCGRSAFRVSSARALLAVLIGVIAAAWMLIDRPAAQPNRLPATPPATQHLQPSTDEAVWQKRWWIEKTARILRGGYGLGPGDDLNALLALPEEEIARRFMKDVRFGDTILDFNMYFLGFKIDDLKDDAEKAYFEKLPTSFKLPPGAVGRLKAVAGKLLNQSETYRTLLHDLVSDSHQPEKASGR